jgi:hypothetical protein
VRRPTVAAPAPRRSASPFPAASVDDGPSPLAREARRLADALHKLRQDDDPAGALALLDGAGAEVPGAGLLKAETNAARVEALLRLHRSEQALSLLDAMTIGPRGPDRERLVTRAELRGRAGRCAEAIADFDALLAGPAPARRPDAMTERALFGRAACRGQRHDQAGARADLTRYLALFPDGRFAAAARDVLRPRAP